MNMARIKFLLSFTAIISTACTVGSFSALAQVPSSADPGVILRDLDEGQRAPSRLEDTIKYQQEDLSDKKLSADKVFTLKKVLLDNTTVYQQADIDKAAADHLGQQVSFADLNAIANTLTRQYRNDGYMFSRVILPPQEIEGGVVHLQVIEGTLTDVEVVGDYKDNNDLIMAFAEKIKSSTPVNAKDLERYLLLIDDLPGIKARSLMQPSSTPGGGKLIITIEQDQFEGSAGIDNRGSKFFGRTRGTLVGAANSLFGIHDRTTGRVIMTKDTEELKFFDLTHEEQIGTEGMRLKGRYAVTSTEPGASLKSNDVEGTSHVFELEGLYPLIRGRQYNLNLLGSFTALNSESDILGIDISEDRVRYLTAGGRFDFTDNLAGVTQIDFGVSQGLDWFNATDDGLGRTRSNGEHDFIRANVTAIRLQDLPNDFSMQISADAQYSPDSLLSSEEFAIGGGLFGRAYDSGEITGDSGIAGAVELRYGGSVESDYLNSYQVYAFYDLGKVWNEDTLVGEQDHKSLASTGLGVRMNFAKDISGYIELNHPLTKSISAEGDDGDDPRIFFSILKRF